MAVLRFLGKCTVENKLFEILKLSSTFCIVAPAVFAQSFNAAEFEAEINAALAEMPGITVEISEDSDFENAMTDLLEDQWKEGLATNAPEFGFVVDNAQGLPVEVLSGAAPFETVNGNIAVMGYELPDGHSIRTVGPAGWVDAVTTIADRKRVGAPSRDIGRAIDTISGAGDYIAQELCARDARPTELVLNLTASFELVFNLETGSQVTWDLEIVCDRY